MQTVHELVFSEDTKAIPDVVKLALATSVKSSAAFLNNEHIPWQKYALESDFDMSHSKRCILGKHFGTFTEGYYRMGWGPNSQEGLDAFSRAVRMGLFSHNRDYMHYLTLLWKRMAALKQTFVT